MQYSILRYDNGEIEAFSYHVGETELGSSFGQAYAKYEEEIATPFADFVHLISKQGNAQRLSTKAPDWPLAQHATNPASKSLNSDTPSLPGPTSAPSATESFSDLLSFDDLPIFSPEIIAAHASTNLGYSAEDFNFENDPFNFAELTAFGDNLNHGTQPQEAHAPSFSLTRPPVPIFDTPLPQTSGEQVSPADETNLTTPAQPSVLTESTPSTTEQPALQEPVRNEPIPPTTEQLNSNEPAPNEPASNEPASNKPASDESNERPSNETEPTLGDPAGVELNSKEPAPNEPAPNEPASNKPNERPYNETEPTIGDPAGVATPEWVQSAVKYMLSLGLGDEWSMLVNMWLSLEKKLEFGTVTGMVKNEVTNAVPPPKVADWMQRNRLYTKTAGDIDDIDEFSNSAMEWWRQMQPLWRQGDGVLPLPIYDPPDNQTWDVLAQGGPTGLLLLVLVLGWWGANQRSQEWHSVVADANKSFASIVKSYVPPPPPSAKARGKRPQVIADEGCNKRAKPSRIASRLREDVRGLGVATRSRKTRK
ncbi:hypothetical protein EYR38_009936 [Pleurotus pulmonarius]|nr:hypothetical protein EYR38_009936 [Pleurotus pulmonarius]